MGQPEVMARLYSPMAKSQGFTSRLLTCEPLSLIGTRKLYQPHNDDVAYMQNFEEYIQSILEFPLPLEKGTRNVLKPRVVPLSEKAKRRLWCFVDEIEAQCRPDGRFAPVREFCAKIGEHSARIAATLALGADFEASQVKVDFIDAGIELARWYAGEALRISGGSAEDSELMDAQKLLDWMHAKNRSVFSLVELYQRANTAARSAAKARKLVEILIEHGWMTKAEGPVEFDGQMRREAYRLT